MRTNGFVTGIIAGATIGALAVLALTPQGRRPMLDNAGEVGDRMRKMWRRGAEAAKEAFPDDVM